jgi:HSP20 family protein
MAKDKEVAVKKASESLPQRFDQQIERMFDDFFRRRWPRPFGLDWPGTADAPAEPALPRVDVVDKEDHLLVRAELPGMTKDDIDVSVTDDSITIKGSVRKEAATDEGDYHRREIYSSTVARTVALPNEVDPDGATAQLKDGMLEVRLPKSARAQRKRLDVQS